MQARVQALHALKITVQADHTLVIDGPAQGTGTCALRQEVHRTGRSTEIRQVAMSDHVEPLEPQGGLKQVEAGEDGRQDGEMGHESGCPLCQTLASVTRLTRP